MNTNEQNKRQNDTKHEKYSQSPIAGMQVDSKHQRDQICIDSDVESRHKRDGSKLIPSSAQSFTQKTATPYTKQDGDRYTDQQHKKVNSSPTRSLEAFSVHNSRTGIIILVLGDPHLLEGGQ